MELIWNEQNQNAVVHEVRSDSPEITLPETVEGRKIVAVGAYCFSDRKRKETGQNGITTVNGEPCDHSAQGEFVEKIALPDAVERIENAAFFNCKKLYALEVGKRTTEIGSDVFNNCSALHKVHIRGKAGEETGAKQLLARISWDVEVQFDDAVLFYPEYYEGYDTIAPAHIWHGSRVTYNVQPSSRQSPSFFDACSMASISACASVVFFRFLLLKPLAIILSSWTMTQPIGTSPFA